MMTLDYVPGNQSMFYDIADLWNLVESYDNLTHMNFSNEFVSKYFQYTGVNLTKDVVLVRRKSGRLSAFGFLFFERNDSSINARLTIMVHPNFRGQGIGKGLLSLMLRKAYNAGCREISCTIPSFRLYSMRFIEKFGFKKTHSNIKMTHSSIEKIDFIETPSDLVLRTIDIDKEIGNWTSLQNEIFRTDLSYSMVTIESIRRIVRYDNFTSDLVILGEVDNSLVGYCVGWLFNPTTSSSNTILRIHALGVLPYYQRKGYGRALICEVLWKGLNMGYTKSELLVGDSNFPAQQLYRELGFRDKYRLLHYKYRI
jgi:ribosomal protein S18 acetylase RimI-like enzyme